MEIKPGLLGVLEDQNSEWAPSVGYTKIRVIHTNLLQNHS
jgi:hypothetical protein